MHSKTKSLALAALLAAGCHDLSYTAPCEINPNDPHCPGVDAGDDAADATSDTAPDTAIDSTAPDATTDADDATDATDANPSCTDASACTPGATRAATGTPCTGALEVATQTCSTSCEWGAATCGMPKGWTKIADPPSGFAGRYGHSAVWTGKEMIVWGGYSADGGGTYLSDGARYDPKTNSWKLLAAPPAGFSERAFHSAVWTGALMAVWFGRSSTGELADGALYDPVHDAWGVTHPSTLSPRFDVAACWFTSSGKMAAWGGWASGLLSDGAVWSGFSQTWASMAAGAPSARSWFAQGCGADSLTIWGGADLSFNPFHDGARFDAASGSWSALPPPPSTYRDRAFASVARIDDGFMVAGGASLAGYLDDAFAWYGGAWHSMPSVTTTASPGGHVNGTSWCIGHACSVWSGGVIDSSGTLIDGGVSFDFDSVSWSDMPSGGAPSARDLATVAVADGLAIVWGGAIAAKAPSTTFRDGAIFVP